MLFQSMLDEKVDVNVFPIREYWLDIGRLNDFEKAQVDYSSLFLSHQQ